VCVHTHKHAQLDTVGVKHNDTSVSHHPRVWENIKEINKTSKLQKNSLCSTKILPQQEYNYILLQDLLLYIISH